MLFEKDDSGEVVGCDDGEFVNFSGDGDTEEDGQCFFIHGLVGGQVGEFVDENNLKDEDADDKGGQKRFVIKGLRLQVIGGVDREKAKEQGDDDFPETSVAEFKWWGGVKKCSSYTEYSYEKDNSAFGQVNNPDTNQSTDQK